MNNGFCYIQQEADSYITNNRVLGSALDSQGFPTIFLRLIEMKRVQ